MSCRVVMPREVPGLRVAGLMWRMWQLGYSCRPTPGAAARRGWVVVEFWVEVEDVSDDVLVAFEIELDDTLGRIRRTAFEGGRGARVEGRGGSAALG